MTLVVIIRRVYNPITVIRIGQRTFSFITCLLSHESPLKQSSLNDEIDNPDSRSAPSCYNDTVTFGNKFSNIFEFVVVIITRELSPLEGHRIANPIISGSIPPLVLLIFWRY